MGWFWGGFGGRGGSGGGHSGGGNSGGGGSGGQSVNHAPVFSLDSDDLTSANITEQIGIPARHALLSAAGTLSFTDVDTTDKHSASAAFKRAGSTYSSPLGTLTPVVIDDFNGDGTGQINWTYAVNAQQIEKLAEGETITETYTITLDDKHGAKVTQDITITIVGTNDDPEISLGRGDHITGSLTEKTGTPWPGTLLATSGKFSFSDVDGADTHSVSVAPSSNIGTLLAVVSSDSSCGTGNVSWVYKVDASAVEYLAAGEVLTETFQVTVNDNHGGAATQTVTVSVKGTNDAPDIQVLSGDSANETINETNAGLVKAGTLTVTDVDLSDVVGLSVKAVAVSGPTGGIAKSQLLGMLSIDPTTPADVGSTSNVTWTFDSHGQAFDYLAPGQHLDLTYTIKASDGHGGSDTQTVKITITGASESNAAPETDATSASGVEDAASIAVVLSGSDVDGTVAELHHRQPAGQRRALCRRFADHGARPQRQRSGEPAMVPPSSSFPIPTGTGRRASSMRPSTTRAPATPRRPRRRLR